MRKKRIKFHLPGKHLIATYFRLGQLIFLDGMQSKRESSFPLQVTLPNHNSVSLVELSFIVIPLYTDP